jgi:ketosteroid isomerase-like protein
MSKESMDVVRSLFEAFVTEGLDAAGERFLAREAEYVEDPIWPGASSYRGRGDIVACFKRYTEALGGEGAWRVSVEKVVDGGERQAALVRLASEGSASGVPHEHLWGYTAQVRDGSVVYLRAHYDPAEALEALASQE